MGCLTKWCHFGGIPVNDTIVTSCDMPCDSKLCQSVYKCLNILWSKFHWCSVRGSWNIKVGTKCPLPPWLHWPKKPTVNRVKIGHFTKENIFVKKKMTHLSQTCWRYHHIWILPKNILLHKGIMLIANVLAKEKIF